MRNKNKKDYLMVERVLNMENIVFEFWVLSYLINLGKFYFRYFFS